MLDKLQNIINQSAKERDIQELLKKDLSFIGKHFAVPENEYIVFSEFPVGNGSVDFVVFTSRSKMEVIFIEIKGSDFNFINNDGTVSNEIKKAEEQIRERFEYVTKNYEKFRREVYDIKRQVEAGKILYNSKIGDSKKLYCDPEKEIMISGCIIGGKTTDDYLESSKKAQMQRYNNPSIRFESWNSFLRKIEDKKNIPRIYQEMLNRKNQEQIPPIQIGKRVRSLVDFASVPKGTQGVVDEYWQSSEGIAIMVAWDLPERPLPQNYNFYDKDNKVDILRDGFIPREFKELEEI
jgi:hypothetical protein